MAIVLLKFVDNPMKIREEFLGFIPAKMVCLEKLYLKKSPTSSRALVYMYGGLL
jgi:hypothetical protein